MARKKAKRTTSAIEIFDRLEYDGRPDRVEELEQTRREMALGLKIRRLREGAGLTQQQLADMIDTQPSSISRIEDADYDAHTLSLLKRVAEALDMRLIIDFESKNPGPAHKKAKIK
jgi:ribosome-binding protein aMBF1 (putative translation factor)